MDGLIIEILGTILGALSSAFSSVIWWLWRTDRNEQNNKIDSLEVRMADAEQHRITRDEFNGVASSIRSEFKEEHSKILEFMRSENESLRTELRNSTMAITDRIDRLIESRSRGGRSR